MAIWACQRIILLFDIRLSVSLVASAHLSFAFSCWKFCLSSSCSGRFATRTCFAEKSNPEFRGVCSPAVLQSLCALMTARNVGRIEAKIMLATPSFDERHMNTMMKLIRACTARSALLQPEEERCVLCMLEYPVPRSTLNSR